MSRVLGEKRTAILHVGRSRGALEYPRSGKPAVELGAARVLEILEAENERRSKATRSTAAERKPVELDAAVLAHLRLTAKKSSLSQPSKSPFEGRPRQCFETTGRHPGEALWVDTSTGEAAIETTVVSKDSLPLKRKFRPVGAMTALRWLRDDGQIYFPKALVLKAGPQTSKVLDELLGGEGD